MHDIDRKEIGQNAYNWEGRVIKKKKSFSVYSKCKKQRCIIYGL